ncbi:kelch-like protein 33 isoform X2 [Trichomycterus rosablanca]
MPLHRTREKKQERRLTLSQRASTPPDRGYESRRRGAERNSPDTLHRDDLHTMLLPSHCDSLFTSFHDLKARGLLLDCTLQVSGHSHRVHKLVLASVSRKAEEWLSSGETRVDVDELAEPGGGVSPAGLDAVLCFAYSGEADEARDPKEALLACGCLEAERLAQVRKAGNPPNGRVERGRNLDVIKTLWERRVGCDVIMEADSGEQIPAHRIVLAAGGDYFRALLCGGLRESNEEVVRLRGVASPVLRSLLEFIYTGQLRLNWRNVWELTEATLQFQLPGANTLCLKFLRDRMDDTTCLDALLLAETFGLEELRRAAVEYALGHFQGLLETENFKDLSCTLLERLLDGDELIVDSEVVAFRAAVSWVEEDQALRLISLPQLLQKIRFPLMTPQELQEVQGCRLLRRITEGREVLDAVRKLLEGQHGALGCKPRVPKQALVLVGGDSVDDNLERRETNSRLWFARRFLAGEELIRTIQWRPLARLPDPPRLRHCACVLNNDLYVLGGRKYYGKLDILKSAVRFTPGQRKWERLADMANPRDYFAAVCQGGKVFVLGGNRDDTNYLDVVEYYTPEDDTWRTAHPLDTPVCGHAATVLDGEIFVSGGCDTRLRCLSSLRRYDPVDGCSARAPMTCGSGRAGHVMLAAGNRLLVAGGLQPMRPGFGDQLQCEAYSPACDCWTRLALLPRPHLSPAATSVDGRLYVLGGSSADTARDTPWVYRYDPQDDSWEKLGTMPRPYADLAACTLQLPTNLWG